FAPQISLINSTPASIAASAVAALYVSIDSGIFTACFTASITGITLFISSSALIGSWSGRVDSPPISIMSAPSSTICLACATAVSIVLYLPPSEKESGVAFRMPIINVCLRKSYCFVFICKIIQLPSFSRSFMFIILFYFYYYILILYTYSYNCLLSPVICCSLVYHIFRQITSYYINHAGRYYIYCNKKTAPRGRCFF